MKKVAAVLLAVLLMAAIPVFGQMTGARLSGTVKDATGAVVTGANVSIRNQATGISQTTDTGSTGLYIFRGLNPGIYDIKAEKTGFQTVEAEGLKLLIGQDLGYDLTLKVGAVKEILNVKAETPLVESEKAQIDTVITAEQLVHTPLNSRFFLDLLFNSTPGVAGNTNCNLGECFSVNGQRGYANQFNIDGTTFTNSTLQTARGRINMDSIQEFQILTHQFEAQYGNASGAVVNVATKTGTNSVHGTGYGIFRDAALDTFNPYQKQMDIDAGVEPVKPENYRRVFGGSIGGPIKANKLFYFVSYEWEKDINIHKILAPQEFNASVPIGPVSGVWSARIDFTPSGRDTFGFRYNGQRSNGIWGPGGWNTKSTEYNELFQPHSWGANWMRTISARTLSELRVQFAATWDRGESNQDLEYPYTIYRPSSTSGKLQNVPFNVPEYNGQLVYNLSMTRGRHDIKVGGTYMRVVSDGSNKNMGDGVYEFNTDAPFDPNNPYTYPWHYIQRLGKDDWHIPENVISAFAQDKWAIRDNLVLTYGLRWDFENFFSSVGELGTFGGTIASSPKTNFSPRISLAYSPFGQKTVIRGGFGRFYSRIPLNEAALIIQNTVNTHDQAFLEDVWGWDCCDVNGNEFPTHQIQYPIPPPLSSFQWNNGSVDVFDDNLKYQYTDHYTVGVQQQIGKQFALNVDFVRILGKDLWTMVNRNAPDPVTNIRPNPDYFRITTQSSIGHSWYTAMEVTFKYTAPKRSMKLTYTWAKSIDDVRGDPNGYGTTCSQAIIRDGNDAIRCDRGLSGNDLPHRITWDGIFNLPYKFIVSGVLDWHPGYPWTIGAGQDLNGDTWTNDRPAGVGRNTERGTRYFWTQMRLGREFKFGERFVWEPYVEAFNVFNNTNYFGYSGSLLRPAYFGKPTGSENGRQLQFGFRVSF
jgi:hypothetical protein